MIEKASVGALCLLTFSGCSEPLSEAECFQLLDQYTELLLKVDNPDVPTQDRERLKSEARAKARRDPAFAECSDRVSRTQFECAMLAKHPDHLEQCML